MKAIESKSTHVTFTLKRENCPTVTLKWKPNSTRRMCQILRYLSRQKTDVANSYICQKKTAMAEIPTDVLDSRKKIGVINIK
jgi:hypothetical protein